MDHSIGLDGLNDDIDHLLREAREQQARIEAAQREIQNTEIVASVERGLVSVVVEGGGRISEIAIDPEAMRVFDADTLGEVVLAAIHDAMGQLVALTKEKMGPLMSDPSVLEDSFTYWREDDDTAPDQRR